ncbi:hypothetical protein NSS74_08930 [Bacillus sp. FSL E2-8868]
MEGKSIVTDWRIQSIYGIQIFILSNLKAHFSKGILWIKTLIVKEYMISYAGMLMKRIV